MIFRIIFCAILLNIVIYFKGDCQFHPTEKQWENSLVFSLVMGDHFKNDSVDIYIDGHQFFRNVKLTSNPSDGCTDVIVDIHKNECGECHARIFRGDTINIKPLPQLINVKLVFNGKPFEFSINPKNGKYALFQKEVDGLLVFRQSHRQPTFE